MSDNYWCAIPHITLFIIMRFIIYFINFLFKLKLKLWDKLVLLKLLYPENQLSDDRHTQYTERAPNEAPPTQIVELGAYHDVAPTDGSSANSVSLQVPHQVLNMETFNIDNSLKREYPMPIINWPTSSGTVVLNTWSFPETLFAQPYISQKIKNFRFFRAGIKATVRIVSTKTLYGTLMLSYIPALGGVDISTYDSPRLRSGFDHVLISASAGETVELTVPFIHPARFLMTDKYSAEEMGSFVLSVLNPLTDVLGAITSAPVFVTFSFVQPHLAYPFVPQMEAIRKSDSQIISSTLETLSDFASSVKNVPFVRQYANIFREGAKPGIRMFKRLGLSKPTTLNTTQIVKQHPMIDFNSGKGLALIPKMAMDPENGISTVPNVGGVNDDEMSLDKLAGLPMMIGTVTLTPSTTTVRVTSDNSAQLSYFDHVRSLFMTYSGGTKIKLYIAASQFHSVRIALWAVPFDGSLANPTSYQDAYHKVVDIQGDTYVPFTIPFLSQTFAKPLDNYTNAIADWALFATVISWSQPTINNTPIYINVYEAAASDVQFYGLTDFLFTPQINPRADFALDFEPLHPSMTGYEQNNLIYGEKYTTMREVIHRYMAYCSDFNTTKEVYSTTGFLYATNSRRFKGLEAIGQFYAFWRGSIRLKLIRPKQDVPTLTYNNVAISVYNDQGNIAGSSISSNVNPTVDLEIPYYYPTLYRYTRNSFAYARLGAANPISYASNATLFLTKAAGDDFSFHHIIPPKGSFSVTPALDPVYGFSGLQNFYTSP